MELYIIKVGNEPKHANELSFEAKPNIDSISNNKILLRFRTTFLCEVAAKERPQKIQNQV